MEPILKEFLDKKQAEQRKKIESERDQLLVSLGLVKCEKEYSPAGKKTRRYKEFDSEVNNYYRIKKTHEPIEVTDEEYAEIRKYKKTFNLFSRWTPVGLFILLNLALCFMGYICDSYIVNPVVVLGLFIVFLIYIFLIVVLSLYNYIRQRDEMKMK